MGEHETIDTSLVKQKESSLSLSLSLSLQVVFTLSFPLLVTVAPSPVPPLRLSQEERYRLESLASNLEQEDTASLSSLLLTSAPRKAPHKVRSIVVMSQLLRNFN